MRRWQMPGLGIQPAVGRCAMAVLVIGDLDIGEGTSLGGLMIIPLSWRSARMILQPPMAAECVLANRIISSK